MTSPGRGARIAGWVLTGLMTAFLLFDSIGKIALLPAVREASKPFGFSDAVLRGIGVVLLICLILYLVPVTRVLGAVLLVGYLGGATATNLRFTTQPFNLAFPVVCGVVVFLGLWLRDPLVRTVLPFRSRREA